MSSSPPYSTGRCDLSIKASVCEKEGVEVFGVLQGVLDAVLERGIIPWAVETCQ